MSEDTKTITGRCAEISERGDWTTFAIDVGTQYPVKLSTKLDPLVELGRAASKDGGEFTWTYKTSQGGENPHKPGTYYTNRYLSGVEKWDGSESASSVATPDTAPSTSEGRQAAPTGNIAPVLKTSNDVMTKEEWARKDAAADKRACIAIASGALQHTMPSDPTPEDLLKFIQRVSQLSSAWHAAVLAERGMLTSADEETPF